MKRTVFSWITGIVGFYGTLLIERFIFNVKISTNSQKTLVLQSFQGSVFTLNIGQLRKRNFREVVKNNLKFFPRLIESYGN